MELMILSLCGCTAACLVNVGFGGSWEGGMNEAKACCMLRDSVLVGLSSGLLCAAAWNHTMLHGYGQP